MKEILNIGDTIFEGDYIKHSEFSNVINYYNESKKIVISFVKKSIGSGPTNIVINNYIFNKLNFSKKIYINNKTIKIKEKTINITNIEKYNSSVKLLNSYINLDNFIIKIKNYLKNYKNEYSLANIFNENIHKNSKKSFKTAMLNHLFLHIKSFQDNLELNEIKNIKSFGFGLTPSGDDYICGVLYGFNIISQLFNKNFDNLINIVYNNAIGSNKLSNSYLYLAKQDRYFESLKNLIENIENEEKTESLLNRVLSFGSTSGSDLITGLIMTLERRDKWLQKV